MLVASRIKLLGLDWVDVDRLCVVAQQYELNYDDAYQYTVPEKFDLTIVSFDHDFDRTPRGRRTPAEVTVS